MQLNRHPAAHAQRRPAQPDAELARVRPLPRVPRLHLGRRLLLPLAAPLLVRRRQEVRVDVVQVPLEVLGGDSIEFWNEFWNENWNKILFYFTANPDSIGTKYAPKIGMSRSSNTYPFKK